LCFKSLADNWNLKKSEFEESLSLVLAVLGNSFKKRTAFPKIFVILKCKVSQTKL